jgi:hypothetical protein
MAGYTVMRVDTGAPGQMKKIVYAGGVDASGELVPTQYEVGKASPQALGLQPGIKGKGRFAFVSLQIKSNARLQLFRYFLFYGTTLINYDRCRACCAMQK